MSREPDGAGIRVSQARPLTRRALASATARGCGLLAGAMALATAAGAGAQTATSGDLLRAVRLDDAASLVVLLDAGIHPDAPDRNGRPALQVAVRYGHLDVARRLLDAGAGIDARDTDGWTALHHAAQGGDIGALRLLLAYGADVDAADPYRYRALHLAAREGHGAACELLVEAGADPGARIDVGFTPATLAERFPDVQDYLLGRQTR